MQALASSSALLRKRKPSKKTLMAYGPAKPMAECSGLSINETIQGRKMQFQPKSRMLGSEQSDTIRSRDSSVSGQGAPLQTYQEKTTEGSSRRGSMEDGQSKDCDHVRAAQLIDMMDSSRVVMSNDPVEAAQPIELMNSSSVITSSGTHSPSPLSTPPHKYEESFITNLDDGDKDVILKRCREACQSITKHKPEKVKGQPMNVNGEFVTGIQILTHFAYEDINSESNEKYIEDLVCKTCALDALLDFVACSLKEWNLSEYDASSSSDYLDWTLEAAQFVCNLSDSNIEVKRGIASNQQAMPVLVKGFDDQAEAHIDGNLSSQQEQTLMLSLAAVHNAASLPENVAALRAHDLITVVRKYLDSPSTYNRMFSISILANLVNESEAAQLLEHTRASSPSF